MSNEKIRTFSVRLTESEHNLLGNEAKRLADETGLDADKSKVIRWMITKFLPVKKRRK